MEPEILLRIKDILAINKPADLWFTVMEKGKKKNLTEWLLKKYPDKRMGEPGRNTKGEIIFRPGNCS